MTKITRGDEPKEWGMIEDDVIIFIIDPPNCTLQALASVIDCLGKLKIGRGEPDLGWYKAQVWIAGSTNDC